jgi:hypothetical protein
MEPHKEPKDAKPSMTNMSSRCDEVGKQMRELEVGGLISYLN